MRPPGACLFSAVCVGRRVGKCPNAHQLMFDYALYNKKAQVVLPAVSSKRENRHHLR